MKTEQAALLRKAQESLRAAKLLSAEHLYDFAASRSYYAMFYIAEAFLLEKGLSFSRHSAVIAAFGQHFAKTGIVPAEFHGYLIRGQESRNVGDYGTGPGLTESDAASQIERAEAFLQEAERFLGEHLPEVEKDA